MKGPLAVLSEIFITHTQKYAMGRFFFVVFKRSLFCSPRLHLFD